MLAGAGLKLNPLVYGYLVEDTPCDATVMKMYIPKLMGLAGGGSGQVTENINSGVSATGGGAGSVTSKQYIEVKVCDPYAHRHPTHDCQGYDGSDNCPNKKHQNTCHHPGDSILKPCPHTHHDHHFPHMDNGMIPSGTRFIIIVMDDNPSDLRVTRLICEYPEGKQPGEMQWI